MNEARELLSIPEYAKFLLPRSLVKWQTVKRKGKPNFHFAGKLDRIFFIFWGRGVCVLHDKR